MESKHAQTCCTALTGLLCVGSTLAHAQADPVFAYQGQLKEAGRPYDGTAYLEFSLWDAPEFGNQIGGPFWTSDGVTVVNGLFTVSVDAMVFGPTAFNGEPRWLQIVLTDWNYFERVELSPRQPITPAPYALYALDGPGGGGDSFWESFGNDIYYTAGNVGVGEIEPAAKLDVNGTVRTTGFTLTETPVAGYILTSDGSGNGTWQPPPGGGGSLWQIGESCILYNGGDVGIGLEEYMWPVAKLEVGGTVKMDGMQLGEFATPGHVLTADVNGMGTWQPAGVGGASLWTTDSEGINYQGGNVGMGTASASNARLDVESSGLIAIHAHASHSAAQTHAIHGEADSTMARTVFADATSTSGVTVGVLGRSRSPTGYGIFGVNIADSGDSIGVYGETLSSNGFGGYFEGRGFFSGNVGIGMPPTSSSLTASGIVESTAGGFKFPDGSVQDTAAGGGGSLWQQTGTEITYNTGNVGIGASTPLAKLDVRGTIKADGLRIGLSATPGHVLTADASGNGTWQLPVGGSTDLVLPFTGTNTTDDMALSILQQGLLGAGGFGIDNPANGQPALSVMSNGTGPGLLAMTASGPAIWAQTGPGGGNAGKFNVAGATATQTALYARNEGAGLAAHIEVTKRENTEPALLVETFSDGPAAHFKTHADPNNVNLAPTILAESDQYSPAGRFRINNSQTTANALEASTVGGGLALQAKTTGVGGAAKFEIANSASTGNAVEALTSGTGHAASFVITDTASTTATVMAESRGGNSAVHAEALGSGNAIFARASLGADAIVAIANGFGQAGVFTGNDTGNDKAVVEITNAGTNPALRVVNTNATSYEAAYFVGRVDVARTSGTLANSVRIQPTSSGAQLKLYDSSGSAAITLDAEYGGVGRITTDEILIKGGSDLSERFDVEDASESVEPGAVLCIDAKHAGKLQVCRNAYDTKVAGIVSGAGGVRTGMMMGQKGSLADGAYPVALTGRVYCKVDAAEGSIQPGDLLTTSITPGYAMKVTDSSRANGAIIGKAMTALSDGQGLVLVLVSLQ